MQQTNLPRVALVATLALLAGCGGSNRPDGDQVARIVRADVHARGGSCDEQGTAVVSNQTVRLYACTMTDVPPQYRQFGSFDNSPQHYCTATTALTEAIDLDRPALDPAKAWC